MAKANQAKQDPLQLLSEAKKGLTAEAGHSFNCYFVGALSSRVKPGDWAKCIETAKRCVGKYDGVAAGSAAEGR